MKSTTEYIVRREQTRQSMVAMLTTMNDRLAIFAARGDSQAIEILSDTREELASCRRIPPWPRLATDAELMSLTNARRYVEGLMACLAGVPTHELPDRAKQSATVMLQYIPRKQLPAAVRTIEEHVVETRK